MTGLCRVRSVGMWISEIQFEGRCNRIELRFFLVVVVVGAVDLGISGRKASEC